MSNTPTKNYVTKAEASRRLGINRPALDRLLARAGAPSPNDSKRYDFAELAAFIASTSESRLDNLRDARLEEVRLRCEKHRRELARDAKETVKRSAVDAPDQIAPRTADSSAAQRDRQLTLIGHINSSPEELARRKATILKQIKEAKQSALSAIDAQISKGEPQ